MLGVVVYKRKWCISKCPLLCCLRAVSVCMRTIYLLSCLCVQVARSIDNITCWIKTQKASPYKTGEWVPDILLLSLFEKIPIWLEIETVLFSAMNMEASDKKKANKLITQPFLGKEKSLKKKTREQVMT